jgi:hypothetical protein
MEAVERATDGVVSGTGGTSEMTASFVKVRKRAHRF